MDKEVLVKVEGVSKKFAKDLKKSLLYGISDIFGNLNKKRNNLDLRKGEFWAVKDVSFELRRGECLGLIGHNGAGKSTLLKMLNGLILPDEGSIRMNGRVGALIELGAGFNPVLTGRENIFNNAAVLGFTKNEILAKFDEIVEFSEIKDFLDMPVQNYSSGMRVRLGFAIAAQVKPDILLIDEVLAVGDIGFVLKCFNKMDQLLKDTALIFVSHSMPMVSRIATKIILLEKGNVTLYSDEVAKGLTKYFTHFKTEIPNYQGSNLADFKKWKVKTKDNSFVAGDEIVIEYNDDFDLELEFDCYQEIFNPQIYLAFFDNEQRNIAEVLNFCEEIKISNIKDKMIVKVVIPKLNFTQGKYSITIALSSDINGIKVVAFRYQSAIYFTVHNDTLGWAPFQIKANWKLLN